MTVQPIDFRSAQHIATELVAKALRKFYDDALVEHGDEYVARYVRVLHRPDSIDGIVTLQVHDDTRGPAIDVTIHVGATPVEPLPTLRLAGEPTDPGSVIRARVGGAR